MRPSPRIFVSVAGDHNLTTQEKQIKNHILNEIQNLGFEIQLFGISGLFANKSWSIKEVQNILSRCQGAVIMCFPKMEFTDPNGNMISLTTNYNHVEGALALAANIPTIVIADKRLWADGILFQGAGHFITWIDPTGQDVFNNTGSFGQQFPRWHQEIEKRFHSFIGYSSAATTTAHAIRDYLERQGSRIMDWQRDFKPANNILSQIEEASKKSLGGIFLFTRDDELQGKKGLAAPRDNVVFEAGYFMHAKGQEKALIILESGAKFPADLGGNIYLSLQDRHNITPILPQLDQFIQNNL